jgi:hypothetical protein
MTSYLTNKVKESALNCVVLVCQPVVVDRGPFRDLPLILACDKDLQDCLADGKVHA